MEGKKMKKTVIRIISLILVAATLLFAFSACGEPVYCDFCGDEIVGRKHKMDLPDYDGSGYVCDECYKAIKEIREEF